MVPEVGGLGGVVVGGVELGSLVGVDPGWGDDPGGAVAHGEVPDALVVGGVVAGAEQGQVVEVGGAAVAPMDEVVGVAAVRGYAAAGDDAASVAGGTGLRRR